MLAKASTKLCFVLLCMQYGPEPEGIGPAGAIAAKYSALGP